MCLCHVPGIGLTPGTQRSARKKPQPAGVSEGVPQLTDVAVLRGQCQGERTGVTDAKGTTRCPTHYKLGGLSGPLVISVETSQHEPKCWTHLMVPSFPPHLCFGPCGEDTDEKEQARQISVEVHRSTLLPQQHSQCGWPSFCFHLGTGPRGQGQGTQPLSP